MLVKRLIITQICGELMQAILILDLVIDRRIARIKDAPNHQIDTSLVQH